jgi:type I restriction enzyme M protein
MKLTLQQLESHLWRASDILRGSMDAADYKRFILPLLFMKRLSDRFDEETQELEQRSLPGQASPVQTHREAREKQSQHGFFVPQEARWDTILRSPTGASVQRAFHSLEEANPVLGRLFSPFAFDDPFRLPELTLRRLLAHFSKIRLRNQDLAEPDLLGRSYEYLLKQFAQAEAGKGGEFYTPREVVRLMVELLQPREGMAICDPTCGTAGMLLECSLYVRRRNGDPQTLILHGQDKNPVVWAMSRMNMLLHNLPARIELGDTIREPKLMEDGCLITYDRVIANPPFSLKDWGFEEAALDQFGRFRYGLPGQFGDLAFVQHMLAVLNERGRMAVVIPNGALFRGNAEVHIRRGMAEDDLVEAVIGLPDKLFYNTGIPTAVLVLTKAKPEERRGRMLFVDASRGYRAGRNQNFLRDEDIAQAADAFDRFGEIPHYARVATVEEVFQNGCNLTVSRYVEPDMPEEGEDPDQLRAQLRQLELERDGLRSKLEAVFTVLQQEHQDETLKAARIAAAPSRRSRKDSTPQPSLFDKDKI